MKSALLGLLISIALVASAAEEAAFAVSNIYGDHMVVQRAKPIRMRSAPEWTNSWADGPDGPHARLEFVAAPEQVAARIEDDMVRRPVRMPSDGAVVPLLSEDGRDPDQFEVLRTVDRRTGTLRPQ